jgi:ABC-2 type transport system permease protein
MFAIYKKELNTFFSSIIGYVVMAIFLVVMWLLLWMFPNANNIIDNKFAALDGFFNIVPQIFIFLIPAITMRSFAEENQTGTIELLATKPLKDWEIVVGKFLANWTLVVFTLLPTFVYFFSVYQLGSQTGNMDIGASIGSYIGLFLLGAICVAIGIFASALTNNQIIAFLLAVFLSFFIYSGFDYISLIPMFSGNLDDLIQRFGINFHYASISRGVVELSSFVYFVSVTFFFIWLTKGALERRKL